MDLAFYCEALTALTLAVVPLYFLELGRRMRSGKIINRGRYYLLAAGLAAVWLVVFYGSFIEPKFLTVKRYSVALDGGGHGRLSVAVISDTHLGAYKHRDWLARVVRRVNGLHPDLVILDGDIVTNAAGLQQLDPLQELKSAYGSFAALGNYDYHVGGVDVRKTVESFGVEVLTNESVPLDIAGRRLRLVGLDDYWFGDPDWNKAMSQVEPDAVKIVIAHNPDFAPMAEARGIDLTVAGHTHGGQIRLPGIGPLDKLPITIGQNFDMGLFSFGPMRLFITPGVGESGPRARLFDPPEVSVLNVDF